MLEERDESQDSEHRARWQPVVLMIRNGERLDCDGCNGICTIILATLDKKNNQLKGVDQYCQPCLQKAQQEEAKRRESL